MFDQIKFTEERKLLIIDASELETAIREVLSDLLDQRKEESKDHRISRKATSERLKKDISTLRRWEKQHMLHPIYVGGIVYYSEREVQLIEEGKR